VRKYLGVLAGAAALCVMSWAQAPATAPTTDQGQAPVPAPTTIPSPPPTAPPPKAPPYPRYEIFGGGSYAEAGLFNTGHWAGLPGWDASLGLNMTRWIGFAVEGGEFFGTSKIPVTAPEPFLINPCGGSCPAPTFGVKTREYNILFGLQFARRKYEGWTPIGELLYGHQGTRGIENFPSGPPDVRVGTGRALVAGAGLDRKISERFALRFKADYFQTASQFPTFAKKRQDNFRFSVGIVIRQVHKKKRTIEEENPPEQ